MSSHALVVALATQLDPAAAAPPAGAAPAPIVLDSITDMLWNGGPLMIPIALSSVVALTYLVERSLRLSQSALGSTAYGRGILAALTAGSPRAALERCEADPRPLGRVLAAGLRRAGSTTAEVEKAVEDAGQREVKRLSANLRPLVVVATIAPLLGLLGTVFGMIEAFTNIALREGLSRPEQVASGISQALITTAAGLAVAIPTQAAYFWLKSRIERFVRRAEDLYVELEDALRARAPQLEPAAGAEGAA
jgi:biopolymer transport protein ExbB